MLMLSLLFTLALADGFCWRNVAKSGSSKPNHCDGDKIGALCFPKCEAGYKANGRTCNELCPKDFKDKGAFCIQSNQNYTKKSYDRGAGQPLKCADDQILDEGLCYSSKCKDPNYELIGSKCYQKCSGNFSVSCNGGCAASTEECQETLKSQTGNIKNLLVKLAEMGNSDGSSEPVDLYIGMNGQEIQQAIFKIAKQILKGLKKAIVEEAKELAKQIVGHFLHKTPIDWSALDVLGVGQIIKDFKKPKCE